MADKAILTGRKIDMAFNAYQAYEGGTAAYASYERGDYLGMALNGVGAGLGGLHLGVRGVQEVKYFRKNFEIVGLPGSGGGVYASSGGLHHLTEMRIRRKTAGSAGAITKSALHSGEGGSYSFLSGRGVAGDDLTPHHMPQAALGMTAYGEGGALSMPTAEHMLTRTYGTKGAITVVEDQGRSLREVLAKDIVDVRNIVGRKYNRGMLDLIQYYRTNFPQLLAK